MKTAISKRILCVALAMVLCFAVIGAHGVTPAKAADVGATYEKVTDVTALKDGDEVIIVASEYAYAMSTNQKNNNRGQAAITKSQDTITNLGSDVQKLTLKAGEVDGIFAFYTGSGYLYAASSSNNYLKTQVTNNANGLWTITIDSNGVATIQAQGTNTHNTLQYNEGSSLFACYTSASQQAISLYKRVESGSSNIDTSNLTITWDSCKLVLDVFPQINFYLQVENPGGCRIDETGYQIWPKGDETEPVIYDVNTVAPIAGAFKTDGNDTYVTTGGLNVNQITDCYWIRAYVKVGEKYIWTDVKEYSVYYYQKCLAAWPDPNKCGNYKTEYVKKTVEAFIKYGEAAATMHQNAVN